MTRIQILFIAATVVLPVLLWVVAWRLRVTRPPESHRRFERWVAWVLAALLFAACAGTYYFKWRDQHGQLRADDALPMHLCDWAAFVTLIALIWRRQTPFEIAYCWGLAGTMQGLLTPAIDVGGEITLREWCFFIIHSVIPAAVLWLIIGVGRRPSAGSWRRVTLWSEIYFALALLTNWVTGGNYGYLAHRPPKASLLDRFPDEHWLYVLTINAVALTVFAVLLTPWRVAKAAGEIPLAR
jgi:hypothetical integral membrane protein (TIGR02206 family)